ncbi:hypothetical protein quinque_010105 [Culex quinquefasciatus]|uniref:classical arabinogalactan protein 4-like n=1 Tax=Culex quinquefasciatus TaxID=7176 RepID=UPI0018E2C66A|nr:classical arabinogalactan protein 4-like [Culex quinquefasciatus]
MKVQILTLAVVFLAGAYGQLLCHHCEDCALGVANIELCGMENGGGPNVPEHPTILPPDNIESTTAPTPPVELPTTAPTPPIINPTTVPTPPADGGPILTPPTFPPTTVVPGATNNPGLATPPITPMSTDVNSRVVIPMEPSSRYGCVTVQSTVGNREVIRRSCARLGASNQETCSGVAFGQVSRCSVCKSHFCNAGL